VPKQEIVPKALFAPLRNSESLIEECPVFTFNCEMILREGKLVGCLKVNETGLKIETRVGAMLTVLLKCTKTEEQSSSMSLNKVFSIFCQVLDQPWRFTL
jgi:hypothetical protein